MKGIRERKSISLHLRIDATTHEMLEKLQRQAGWLGTSAFIRACVVQAAIKLNQEEARTLYAVKRADDETPVAIPPDIRLSPGERWHGTPKPVFDPTSRNFRPYLNLNPQANKPNQKPLRKLPTAIDDSDNT